MQTSSCVYGQIEVTDGAWTWTYGSAGHLPPLLMRCGEVTALPSPHGPPLGALPGPLAYSTTRIEVQPGDVIVLYTDGLVERRDEDIEAGIERLARQVSCLGSDDDLFATSRTMVAQMTAGSSTTHDIALVLLMCSAAGVSAGHEDTT